jgi:hypothetical protein
MGVLRQYPADAVTHFKEEWSGNHKKGLKNAVKGTWSSPR